MQENKFKGGEKVRTKQGIFQNRSTKLHLGEIVTVIGIHPFAGGEERYVVQSDGDTAFPPGYYGWTDDSGRDNLQYVHGSEIELVFPIYPKEKTLSPRKLPTI